MEERRVVKGEVGSTYVEIGINDFDVRLFDGDDVEKER